jgi:hypothetical protein
MFSVLWSDSSLYKEKPIIIVSPVGVQLSVESQPVERRLCVCCSYSETVINPLPGYNK